MRFKDGALVAAAFMGAAWAIVELKRAKEREDAASMLKLIFDIEPNNPDAATIVDGILTELALGISKANPGIARQVLEDLFNTGLNHARYFNIFVRGESWEDYLPREEEQ